MQMIISKARPALFEVQAVRNRNLTLGGFISPVCVCVCVGDSDITKNPRIPWWKGISPRPQEKQTPNQQPVRAILSNLSPGKTLNTNLEEDGWETALKKQPWRQLCASSDFHRPLPATVLLWVYMSPRRWPLAGGYLNLCLMHTPVGGCEVPFGRKRSPPDGSPVPRQALCINEKQFLAPFCSQRKAIQRQLYWWGCLFPSAAEPVKQQKVGGGGGEWAKSIHRSAASSIVCISLNTCECKYVLRFGVKKLGWSSSSSDRCLGKSDFCPCVNTEQRPTHCNHLGTLTFPLP